MRPRTLSFAHLSENNHLIAQGARRLGVSFAIHQLTTHSPKENRFTVTDKKSNVEQLIIPAMSDDDNPLTLIPNCDVTKVIIKNNQAVGVKCIVKPHWVSAGVLNDPYDWHIPVGTEIDIRANKVVLSAGAFGTTKILLKTKEINNKNIGRGITAHPGFTVVGEFASPIDHDQGAQSGVFVDEYVTVDDGEIKPDFVIETAAGSPALLAVMVPGNPDEVAQGVAHAQFQAGAAVILFDSAQRKNRVALNLRGEPEIYYQLSESDKNRAVEGICKLIELLFAAGATRVSFPTHEDVLGDDDLTEYSFLTHPSQIELVRQNLRLDENKSFVISGHLLGANKLGVDAKTSVVNPEHQVWGVKNLYVVDGGVFPASPHANPMATIFAIADLFAEEQIEKNVKIISEK
jgi:choline dehydrogenase-like flavoprotein